MNEALARIVDAHEGIDHWNRSEKVNATIGSGEDMKRIHRFPLKGLIQEPDPSPQDSLAGHQMSTPWTPCIVCISTATPWGPAPDAFSARNDGVTVEETEPWQAGFKLWRVIKAYFPGSIGARSLVQDFWVRT
jgi:hypothetical protein